MPKKIIIVTHEGEITSVYGDNIEYTVRKFGEKEEHPGPLEAADWETSEPLEDYDDKAERTVVF